MAKPSRAAVLALLPAAAAAQPASLVERVDATSGLLYLRAHGLSDGDQLELELVRDTTVGAPTPALPAGLAEGTTYEAVPATAASFALRPVNGSTIASFDDDGIGRIRILFDPWPPLDDAIDEAWNGIIARCTAHGGDVEAPILTDAAKYLAVRLYVPRVAAGDPEFAASFDGLKDLWAEVYAPLLDKYFAGVPVRGATDATPNVSEGSPRFVKLNSTPAASTMWGTCSSEVV